MTCEIEQTKGFTWFRSLRNAPIPDLVQKFWSVVIHIYYIDDNVYGIFHLVSIYIHCVCPQLRK